MTVAPLIPANRMPIATALIKVASRVFAWLSATLRSVFHIPKAQPLTPSHADVVRAVKTLETADKARPGIFGPLGPVDSVKQFFQQNMIPLGISALQGEAVTTFQYAFNAFLAQKAMDISANALVKVGQALHPASSDAVKKAAALTLTGPAVWIAADRLGYPQGYLFLIGTALSVYQLSINIYACRRARALNKLEAERFGAA